jgi:oligoendopeptidase F
MPDDVRSLASGITWNLSDLYASSDDPALQRDLDEALARARAFADRYRGTIDVSGGPRPQWVAAGIAELESICEQADKPAIYAGLLHASDARPPEHGALVARTQEKNSEIRSHLLFFDLEWIGLDDALARPVIDSPACERWRHHPRARGGIAPTCSPKRRRRSSRTPRTRAAAPSTGCSTSWSPR